MRLIIAEDMLMFRQFVTKFCREQGHEVVAETASAVETLTLCRTHRPDALLVEVRLTDGDGLDVAQAIRLETPMVKIIVLTGYTSAYFVHRVAKAVVDAYIDKNGLACAAISEALAAAARGEKWFSPAFHREREQQSHNPEFFGKLLTDHEQMILGLIGQSYSDAEIAAQLGSAIRTVQWHRSNLLRKLHLDSTPKLIAFAIENGFVPIAFSS